MKLAAGGWLEMCRIAGFALLEVFLGLLAFLQHDQWRLPYSCFHSCMITVSVSSLSDTAEVTLSSLSLSLSPPSVPWQPTRPPALTPTRPREWTWPTASPTCGSKPKSTAWTRCPQSTERRGEEEGTPAAAGPLAGGCRLWNWHRPPVIPGPRRLLCGATLITYKCWSDGRIGGLCNDIRTWCRSRTSA